VTTSSGGGIWSNFQMSDSAGAIFLSGNPFASMSYARQTDGQDTNNNELDFGVQVLTPNAANGSQGQIASLPYIQNFDAADNTVIPEITGDFQSGRTQNPAAADGAGAGSPNPTVIPASPQGGNVGVVWDGTGGGNAGIYNLKNAVQDLQIQAYVYIPAALTGADEEQGTYFVVRGHPDMSAYNFPPANGEAGIRVRYVNNATSGTVLQVDQRANGVSTVFGEQTIASAGWQRVFLKVQGTAVTARIGGTYDGADGTLITGTTTINQAGGIGFGYREVVAVNANCRPLTMDRLGIRPPAVASVDGWSLY